MATNYLSCAETAKLIPFRVTVTTASQTETISILAPHSCAATIQVVEMMFGEFDADKPEAFAGVELTEAL